MMVVFDTDSMTHRMLLMIPKMTGMSMNPIVKSILRVAAVAAVALMMIDSQTSSAAVVLP